MLFLHQIKKYGYIITVLFLVLIGVVFGLFFQGIKKIEAQNHPFAGGSGTEDDPYQIKNVEQLQAIDNYLNSHFVLINNIEADDTRKWNDGQGFDPIGGRIHQQEEIDPEEMFTGSFDGQGFKITNLYINRPATINVGLFGYTSGAKIKNVKLENVSVTGKGYVGGLVGHSDKRTIIYNSYVTGSVRGSWYGVGGFVGHNYGIISHSYATAFVVGGIDVGGLVGWNGKEGLVSSCYSTGSVSGDGEVGGLVGNNYGTIFNSYSMGSISSSSWFVGGLVGNDEGTISNSYATGSVRGDKCVGGFVGLSGGIISNSYSTGSVSGNKYVGGFVGTTDGTIFNSYSTGSVKGGVGIGAFVGWNDKGIISNSFWDIEASGIERSDGGTKKTTAEMKNVRTYTDVNFSEGLTSPWDFVGNSYDDQSNENIWNIDKKGIINNGYPFLVDIETQKILTNIMEILKKLSQLCAEMVQVLKK